MEKYVEVFAFEVVSKIAEGKVVYMLDKRMAEVSCVNGLPVSKYAEVMKESDTAGRFDFWYIDGGVENAVL